MSKIINSVDDLSMIKITCLTLLLVLFNNTAFADFSCTAEVRYKWIPDKSSGGAAAKDTASSEKSPTEAPAAVDAVKDAKGDPSVTSEVFWGTIEAAGSDEALAKLKLFDSLNKERGKADGACREAHENQTKCIAGKYSQNAAVLSMMSFSQRREVEKTIIADCTNTTGRCIGSSSTEPVCREAKIAEAVKPTPVEEKKTKESKKK